jgi:hypothetical protein
MFRLPRLPLGTKGGDGWRKATVQSSERRGAISLDETAKSVRERPGIGALKLLYQFAFLLVAFLVACYSGLPLERFTALVVLVAAVVLWPEWTQTPSGRRLLKKATVASKGYLTASVLRFLCQFAFLLGGFLLVRLKPWPPYRLAALVAVVAAGALWQEWTQTPSGRQLLGKATHALNNGHSGSGTLKLLGQFAFLLGAFLLTYPKAWPAGQLAALVILVAAVVLWPEWVHTPSGLRLMRSATFQNLTTVAVSILFTFVVLGLPLEALLRTDYSKRHLLGRYGAWPDDLVQYRNSRRYRDVEHEVEKPTGVTRIVILGDSFAFGQGVADEEIFARVLARMVGPQVEVINMAKGGWGTVNQFMAFQREGLAYEPDVVIVAAVTNDPEPSPSGQQPEWEVFTHVPVNLDLFRFLDYQLNRLGDTFGLRMSYGEWEDSLYDPEGPGWTQWQLVIHEFGELLSSEGIPGYAFILPSAGWCPTCVFSPEEKYRLLEEGFAEAGFRAYNLFPAYSQEFEGVPEKDLWALPNDRHPSARVHRFYAEQMYSRLVTNGLLK